MAIKQLSVFLENKQGQLSEAVKTISDAGINIRALSIGESKDFGILTFFINNSSTSLVRLLFIAGLLLIIFFLHITYGNSKLFA